MTASFDNLERLSIRTEVTCASMAVTDFRSVLATLTRFNPTEVYNLAGQSSVALSFEQPVEAMESIATGTLNLLEAIRFTRQPIKLYNAGSGERFGDTGDARADEGTPFHPRSPYAVAKAAAQGLVTNYRDAYGIFACTGILFNHESPLRPERFVTQKIAHGAARIAAGGSDKLRLGTLAIHRDWGWAPEYVDAMWRMLQQQEACDLVWDRDRAHGFIGIFRRTSLRVFRPRLARPRRKRSSAHPPLRDHDVAGEPRAAALARASRSCRPGRTVLLGVRSQR